MDFRTIVDIKPPGFWLGYGDKGLMAGSCFTDNIGEKMTSVKMPVISNPFGVVYNPVSIVKTLTLIEKGGAFPEDGIMHDNGLWFDFSLHSSFSSTDKEILIKKANESLKAANKMLKESSYLIITLGSAWVYEYIETGSIVCNCHKVPAGKFNRRMLEVSEITAVFENLLSRNLYRDKKIIFTVSPVRHRREGFAENQLSKASLILSVHKLAQKFGNVYYFPAYEIMMDELRDYRFYKSDMIHPSEVAVDYIWERFRDSYFSKEAIETAARISNVVNAVKHRPINPGSPTHIRFKEAMLEEIGNIKDTYPELDFSEETDHFSRA